MISNGGEAKLTSEIVELEALIQPFLPEGDGGAVLLSKEEKDISKLMLDA
jgi:hypothetical protein